MDTLAATERATADDAPPALAVRTAPARLLEYEHGHRIALPLHTTIEVLDRPRVVAVPGAAYYCNGMTKWQGRWLPVLDLHVLLYAYREAHAPPTRHLLVVAYQAAPRGPVHHGAIGLPAMPITIEVADSALCPLPNDCDLWPKVALSCFEHEGRAIPIIDTARLFAGYHG